MSLRILLLSHKFHPDIGGIEVNSEIYASAFAGAGHEVRILTWSSTVTAEDSKFPFKIIRNPSTSTLFQQHEWADIVFENNPCVRLAWPAVLFGRPSVIALNTAIEWESSASWLKRKWLRRADAVISVSEAVRKQNWPASSVIGNPYRAKDFMMIPDVNRTNNFVFLGRLVSQKGVAMAIQAFHRVLSILSENKDYTEKPSLTIIGDGPERENLEALVASLDIKAYVNFIGFLEGKALARELNRYRYQLVPSLYGEAFGNVVLEGMACGCLPIVSNSDGLPDAAGKAGLVFQRGSVESLASTILGILQDPSLELELRRAAPAHLSAHQPEVVAARYLRILEVAAGYRRVNTLSEVTASAMPVSQ
ncbi:glycosyltransferase family 4 protein [uncultured Hymenobacter sp.]|uniref:glycosyltransferase family 4 protein n=1 Tax=uncultured Hymenobacter sp. TaxID=170016 RepID=UPI0035CAA571